MVLVWLDWLVFCEYGFSVFAVWSPLATLTVLLGFLLPWTWGISSRLLQQSTAIAPYLGWGVSPHHSPSWPSTWDSSSRPSCTHAATAPWTWGWSSRPSPLALGVGLLHQHKSAICVHMSPPSWTSLSPPSPSHPSRLSQNSRLSSLHYIPSSH